jgi:indole-3-glycerol phosphate synthase
MALSAGAHVLGINHRDLSTFQLDPTVSERLVPDIPSGKILVIESGVTTAEDVKRVQKLGAHAVLIGEALMTAPDPAAKIHELFAGIW